MRSDNPYLNMALFHVSVTSFHKAFYFVIACISSISSLFWQNESQMHCVLDNSRVFYFLFNCLFLLNLLFGFSFSRVEMKVIPLWWKCHNFLSLIVNCCFVFRYFLFTDTSLLIIPWQREIGNISPDCFFCCCWIVLRGKFLYSCMLRFCMTLLSCHVWSVPSAPMICDCRTSVLRKNNANMLW